MKTLLLALVVSISTTAWAAPVSVTVSGGVSLGSYQAGYLYYVTELFKRNPRAFDLKSVTGGSSGSINALLSILTTCSPKVDSPTDSTLWKTWTPIGLRDLLGSPSSRRASGILGTDALDSMAVQVRKIWDQGLDSGCDVVLGVTTTLMTPEQISLGKGLEALHQELSFNLRIRGRGYGMAPELTNYVNPHDRISHALLYLPEDNHDRFDSLRDLLLASSAFPGAFPPRKLKFCMTDPAHPSLDCGLANAREEYFIDGGVYDNEPISLAVSNSARGLQKDSHGQFHWETIPHLDRVVPPKEVEFHVFDATSKTFPSDTVLTHDPGADTPIATAMTHMGENFVSTIRSQELYMFLSENPDFANPVHSTLTNFPIASEPLITFFGFFDRGFREYDYYLGMDDARKAFQSLPELAETESDGWKPFRCLRATLDHESRFASACDDPRLANFKILMQLSLNRLYSNCGALPSTAHPEKYPSNDCQRAYRGDAPPAVIAQNTNWKRDPKEDEAIYSLRFLYENNYRFENVPPGQPPKEILTELRNDVHNAVTTLADHQPADQGAAMKLAVVPAVNIIEYVPPPREFHLLIGDLIEGGGSLAVTDFFRMTGAWTFHRLPDVFSKYFGSFSMGPFLGFELESKKISNAFVQPRLGARTGWQLTPIDHWGGQACALSGNDDACTRWAIEPYLSLSIYERVRLQFVERILPASRGLPTAWDAFIQLGFELTP